jgi:hypothetical protein
VEEFLFICISSSPSIARSIVVSMRTTRTYSRQAMDSGKICPGVQELRREERGQDGPFAKVQDVLSLSLVGEVDRLRV